MRVLACEPSTLVKCLIETSSSGFVLICKDLLKRSTWSSSLWRNDSFVQMVWFYHRIWVQWVLCFSSMHLVNHQPLICRFYLLFVQWMIKRMSSDSHPVSCCAHKKCQVLWVLCCSLIQCSVRHPQYFRSCSLWTKYKHVNISMRFFCFEPLQPKPRSLSVVFDNKTSLNSTAPKSPISFPCFPKMSNTVMIYFCDSIVFILTTKIKFH